MVIKDLQPWNNGVLHMGSSVEYSHFQKQVTSHRIVTPRDHE